MNCQTARTLIEKLVDDEATARERAAASAHLGSCESCRAEKQFLERAADAIRSRVAADSDPGPEYWDRLPERVLARLDEKPTGRLHRAYPILALAATVVLAVTVLMVNRDERPRVPPAAAQAPQATEAPSVERSGQDATGQGDRAAQEVARDETAARERALAPAAGDDLSSPLPSRSSNAAASGRGLPSEELTRSAQRLDVIEPPSEPEPQQPTPPPVAEEARFADQAAAMSAEAAVDAELEEQQEEQRERGEAERAFESPSALRARNDLPAAPQAARRVGSGAALSATTRSPCEALREEIARLSATEDEPERVDKRHELARCSLQRYETFRTEALRERAVGDIEAFLAVEPQTDRAEALRRALARMQ